MLWPGRCHRCNVALFLGAWRFNGKRLCGGCIAHIAATGDDSPPDKPRDEQLNEMLKQVEPEEVEHLGYGLLAPPPGSLKESAGSLQVEPAPATTVEGEGKRRSQSDG